MDYSKGKIYKILNTITDDVYVGSTCVSLDKRFAKHKSLINCKKSYNYQLYQKMRELGSDVFYIKLIQEAPSDNKAELRAVEGKYIRELGTLNNKIAGRNKEEWTKENEEHNKVVRKEHYENNKEAYRQRERNWRENNREKYNTQQLQYYHSTLKHKNEKITCPCGAVIGKLKIRRHERSKQHQQALENLNNINNVLLQTDN